MSDGGQIMQTIQKLLLTATATAASLAAQDPSINLVVNAAGGIPAARYGIAQGSLFVIYGVDLGPKAFQFASPPFPTTGLAGTSINITVSGTTVSAPIYYTGARQVGAVLPSNTPVGSGALTLTYSGKNASSSITVVPAYFGIFNSVVWTDSSAYLGNAAVTFPNYQYVSATNTAKPGDILTIWGTGLGATPDKGGDNAGAPFGNIGNAPLVFVGGIQSPSVTYWGRSPNTIPGLDQINFVVPLNAPLGCNVSIIVQTATPVAVSNGPTIALAASNGGTCSDPTQDLPPFVFNRSGLKTIFVALSQNVSTAANSGETTTTTTQSGASARFVQFNEANPGLLTDHANLAPSLGTCYSGFSNRAGGLDSEPGTQLNAGTSVTLTSASDALTLPVQYTGFYASPYTSTALPGGTWSFSNGAGGPDVGPLSFTFPVPQPVTWTNQASVVGSPIVRANPLMITWSGGDSNSYVQIDVSTFVGTASVPYYVGFRCAAPASAGQFTIPPSVLSALPAGAAAEFQLSTVAVPFSLGTVPGLDAAVNESKSTITVPISISK
jgi:uncharacterized protein (TIGR03437 family)